MVKKLPEHVVRLLEEVGEVLVDGRLLKKEKTHKAPEGVASKVDGKDEK